MNKLAALAKDDDAPHESTRDSYNLLMRKLLCQTILLVIFAAVFTVFIGMLMMPFLKLKDEQQTGQILKACT